MVQWNFHVDGQNKFIIRLIESLYRVCGNSATVWTKYSEKGSNKITCNYIIFIYYKIELRNLNLINKVYLIMFEIGVICKEITSWSNL